MDSSSLQHGPTCNGKRKTKVVWKKISNEQRINNADDWSEFREKTLCVLYNHTGCAAVSSKTLKMSIHTP